ncbi:hypothetical protein OY671_012188, partial [Metschnikowia pulcherrima]
MSGARHSPSSATPAVGWAVFSSSGFLYFAMAYSSSGSVFSTIGGMASTVREVQTSSMPVTMMQSMVFFFASYASAHPGSAIEWSAVVFPLSSPFAMSARAAQGPASWPHSVASAWQGAWVSAIVRMGARSFRRNVMKSGGARKGGRSFSRSFA